MADVKCEHGKFRGLCSVCRPKITQKPLGANFDKWNETWHAHRLESHARIASLLRKIEADGWNKDTYYSVYDKPASRTQKLSEQEDPTTLNGALWLALVKMVDITVEGRRIQGYNARADWQEARTRLFEKYSPNQYRALLENGQLKIHGGNAAWSHQQRAPDLIMDAHVWDVLRAITFGGDGRTPDALDDGAAEERIAHAQALARELNVSGFSIPFCSKIFQIFDPRRWPVTNTRATSEAAGEAAETEIAAARTPAAYVEYARTCRKLAASRGLPDLEMLDISFSNEYEAEGGRALGS